MAAKRMTLRERAARWARKDNSVSPKIAGWKGWLAGHRANRLTRAERAVVEAYCKYTITLDPADARKAFELAVDLNRVKGRK